MIRLASLAAVLLLGGCAALPMAGAAGTGGALGVAVTAKQDGDALLAADAPLKQLYCAVEIDQPHAPVFAAALHAYCGNIPRQLSDLPATWLKVLTAMKLAEATEKAPKNNVTAARQLP